MLAVLLALAPALAAADRGVTPAEGPGFRVTPSTVLHPAAALEVGYDSNVALATADVGAAFLRLLLRADYASRPPQRLPGVGVSAARQKIDFRLGLSVERRDYLSGGPARALSSWQLDEVARVTVNPQGNVTGGAGAGYVRTLLPRNFEPLGAYLRDVVTANAYGAYRTRRGRYELRLGYEFTGDWFETSDLRYANALRHLVRAVGRKELLPRLGLSLEISVAHLGHEAVGTVLEKADSTPLTVLASLQGTIRPRLAGTLKLGYVNGFYEERANVQNRNLSLPVVEVEAVWQVLPPTGRVAGGYGFTSADAITGNFFFDNLVYLRYDQLLVLPRFRSFLGTLRAAYRHRSYRGLPTGFMSRADDILQIQATIDLPLKDWLICGVGYEMSADFTEFTDPAGIPYHYVRHEAFAKVQASY